MYILYDVMSLLSKAKYVVLFCDVCYVYILAVMLSLGCMFTIHMHTLCIKSRCLELIFNVKR